MSALVSEREKKTAFAHRVPVWVEKLVDDDTPVTVDGAEDVGLPTFRPRDIVAGVKVVELNAELEVLLDDVLDRDRRFENDPPCILKFREQRGGVAFDSLLGEVGNMSAHLSSFICIHGASAR